MKTRGDDDGETQICGGFLAEQNWVFFYIDKIKNLIEIYAHCMHKHTEIYHFQSNSSSHLMGTLTQAPLLNT